MMVNITTESTSRIVYERIREIYEKTGSPVPLYILYQICRKKDNLSTKQIRWALKWLFDHDKLEWKDWHLIPLKEVEGDEK